MRANETIKHIEKIVTHGFKQLHASQDGVFDFFRSVGRVGVF